MASTIQPQGEWVEARVEKLASKYVACGLRGDVVPRRLVVKAIQVYNRSLWDEVRAERAKDWTTCRCAIHRSVVHSQDGGAGCSGRPPGTHGAIRALYDGTPVACALEAPVAQRDKQLFELVEFGKGKVTNAKTRYSKGVGTTAAALGAGYCYAHFFEPFITMRVARILGPNPEVVRLLRYVLLVGADWVPSFDLEQVGDGGLHVHVGGGGEVSKQSIVELLAQDQHIGMKIGMVDGSSSSVSDAGLAAIGDQAVVESEEEEDPVDIFVEVGRSMTLATMDVSCEARVKRLRFWLIRVGVDERNLSDGDLAAVTVATAKIAPTLVGVKGRVKMFEQLGDRFLAYATCLCAARAGRLVADFQRFSQAHDNAELATLTTQEPLASLLDVATLQPASKARANTVEALVGLVAACAGPVPAFKLCVALRLVPGWHTAPAMLVRSLTDTNTALDSVAALLDEYKRRGGDGEELKQSILGLLA